MPVVGPDPAPDDEPVRPCQEAENVIRWRYDEAIAAGCTRREARMYAESDIDAERLRELVRVGWPAARIGEVLL